MTKENQEHTGAEKPGGVSMVQVPASKTREVLDFIAGLDDVDDDVQGHMLSLGVSAVQKRTELTNCHHTGEQNQDWSCADVTTW
jgi:hypothetical protein